MDLTNKNIILTGASSGIGLELLKLLSKYDNVKIIAIARHTESIPVINDVIIPFAADMSKKEEIDRLFEYTYSQLNTIDIFIANAGFAYLEELKEPDWQHIEKIYQLNVFSPIYTLERLAERNPEKPKAFVCTVSGAGLVSLPYYTLYCSTKAALHHFINTYRYEKLQNLQITTIYPVATKTGFFDKAAGKEQTPLPFPRQKTITIAKSMIKGIRKGKKKVYPSLLFRIFYPIGRAFPFLIKIYSLNEKRKVRKWLEKKE